jgi:hypothetical protein
MSSPPSSNDQHPDTVRAVAIATLADDISTMLERSDALNLPFVSICLNDALEQCRKLGNEPGGI